MSPALQALLARHRASLSDTGYELAMALAARCDPLTHSTRATNKELQAATGLSERCIQYRKRELEALGLLTIIPDRYGHRHAQTIYQFLSTDEQAPQDPRNVRSLAQQRAKRARERATAALHRNAEMRQRLAALEQRRLAQQALQALHAVSADDAAQIYEFLRTANDAC